MTPARLLRELALYYSEDIYTDAEECQASVSGLTDRLGEAEAQADAVDAATGALKALVDAYRGGEPDDVSDAIPAAEAALAALRGARGPLEVNTGGGVLVEVDSLHAAAHACRVYIEAWGLGSREWSGGELREHGETIGHVSYNGRAWDLADKEIVHCPGCKADDGWDCDLVDVRDPGTYLASCGGAK